MNILNKKNRGLLDGLIKQSDILNTIHGGSLWVRSQMEEGEHLLRLLVHVPTIKPDHIRLLIKGRELILFSILDAEEESFDLDTLVAFPLFLNRFALQDNIDTAGISSVHEKDLLTITLPFYPAPPEDIRTITIKRKA